MPVEFEGSLVYMQVWGQPGLDSKAHFQRTSKQIVLISKVRK